MKTALLFSSVLLLLLAACSTPAPNQGPSATTPVSTTATTTITTKTTTSRGNKNLNEKENLDKDKSGLKFQPGPSGGDSPLTLKDLGEISSSLTRVQLIRVIKAARPGLIKCSRRLRDTTSYRLTVTVMGTGKVSSVTMDKGAGTPLETCVRAVWSRMIFPAFKRKAITFNYLFRAPSPAKSSPAKDSIEKDVDQKVNTGHKRDGEGSEDL
ncbi:hypothetical protein KKF84_12140 [Myxococcota bacterium]|nr:hypothetical protein [Myxococcota bacterium]MBU1536064.1 hypothetical protein [Myxococcota bacterium]